MSANPNLLFILDDQHRFDFLGLEQSGVATPHLDALAAQGTRFTHCCVNAPVCAPSRIALATGLHPWRLGCLDNHCYLPRQIPTYYQRLRDQGYQVASVGKLDLAKPAPYNGRYGRRACNFQWGFTDPLEVEGKMHAGRAARPAGPYGFHLVEQGLFARFREDYARRSQAGWIQGVSHDSVLPEEAHSDSWIGRRALTWLENVTLEDPWHLFVSFVGPHDPFDPPTPWAARFRDSAMPTAVAGAPGDKPVWVQHRQYETTAAEIAHTRRQYAANIALIDHWVGRMREMLAARGMADNTYVVFASDHGEMLGDHRLYTKSVAYEGALRVPLILAGPDIPAGGVSHTLVELADVNPTLCEMAGVPYTGNELEVLDARSVMPSVRDTSRPHRPHALAQLRNFAALRTETHKLIDNYNDRTELYDLVEDPGECHNLVEEHPQLVSDLRAQMQARRVEGAWNRW